MPSAAKAAERSPPLPERGCLPLLAERDLWTSSEVTQTTNTPPPIRPFGGVWEGVSYFVFSYNSKKRNITMGTVAKEELETFLHDLHLEAIELD
jgi:hypothetical protein